MIPVEIIYKDNKNIILIAIIGDSIDARDYLNIAIKSETGKILLPIAVTIKKHEDE